MFKLFRKKKEEEFRIGELWWIERIMSMEANKLSHYSDNDIYPPAASAYVDTIKSVADKARKMIERRSGR